MALAVQPGSCCSPTTSGSLGFSVKNISDSSTSTIAFLKPIEKRSPLSGVHTKVSTFLGRTSCFSRPKYELFGQRRKGRHVTRASGDGYNAGIAPCEFESPIGQFLLSLLQSHPHLFADAADQQIQQLAADREASHDQNKKLETTGADIVLYKRIAQVKEQERNKSVVEVIYSLVVQKFLAAGMSLVPKLPDVPSDQRVDDNWPYMEQEMISIHSPEVLEVVKDHLGMILGKPISPFHEQHTLVHASKLRIGHLYAATIIFGYFLRRLDQRYQLDMSMKKALGSSSSETEVEVQKGVSEDMDLRTNVDGERLAAEANVKIAEMAAARKSGSGLGIFPQLGWRPSKLKSYVLSMDQDTLQRFAKLRCKESLDVVDKQTQALFGNPQAEMAPDGSLVLLSGDMFTISLAGLRRLVLEAVAFGSFLWDAESYVDSYYNLV